ncbi:MAG: hypothetical protein HXY34_09900 [Candidatus Thorarchaeota archaeon]|nr:hypothetical protein [Candidatus Thorarchaeota archaeon]
MSDFAKDKKTGELAVKKVYALLKKKGYGPRLPLEPQKDHDIVLGDGRKVEVKFDVVMDTTHNLGVEWWSDRDEHLEGWGQYCEADILIQFYNMDNAVVVDWHKFKEWIRENMDELEMKQSNYSSADVILVPIEKIPEHVKIPELAQMFSLEYDLEQWEIDAITGKRPRIAAARSGRSICGSCGEAIPRNELRIQTSGYWMHLECAIDSRVVSVGSLERLSGYDMLTEQQVQHIRDLLEHKSNRTGGTRCGKQTDRTDN